MKHLQSGTAICEFGLAVNRKSKTASGDAREEVLFVDCVAFGKTGELIAQHFHKGKPILCDGRLKFDQWEDKQGGGKRSKLSVVVESFVFIGSAGDSERKGGQHESASREMPTSGEPFNADDIPF